MSKETEVKPCLSMELRKRRKIKTERNQDEDEGNAEGPKGFVQDYQDQIIVAPEIMSMILENLNFRSLKQARLVCNSWHREAGAHMEKRGVIVRLNGESGSMGFQQFFETQQKRIPALPQPFHYIDMQPPSKVIRVKPKKQCLSRWRGHYSVPRVLLVNQLSSLCPPLALITRFIPWSIPFPLAFSLINQCSSSLEYLQLIAVNWDSEYMPKMDPDQQFPKLRHLNVDALSPWSNSGNMAPFPSIIAWIAKASPSLEVYELRLGKNQALAAELVSKVDIEDIKTLKLGLSPLNYLAYEHFTSLPFRQLEHLKICFRKGDLGMEEFIAIMQVVEPTSMLRVLELSGIYLGLPAPGFLVYVNVQEISISTLYYVDSFVPNHFPSLQTLTADKIIVKLGSSWKDQATFLGLKTLRLRVLAELRNNTFNLKYQPPQVFRIFEKFPDLENLHTRPSLLMRCCELRASGDQRFSNLLAGVKHVVLDGDYKFRLAPAAGSLLAVLKGVETVTMIQFNQAFLTSAVKELPDLKTIEFPWGAPDSRTFPPNMKSLLEITKDVGKVVITNCCSFPRGRNNRSKELLEQYFASAPNAHCGCKAARNMPSLFM